MSTIVSEPVSRQFTLYHSTFLYLDLAAGQKKGSAPWTAIGSKLLNFIDQEYIPPAWRTVNLQGGNQYKFLDPSKFPMEMVTEALQFWYDRQEKGKVAFRFKSFLEGKVLLEAPPRKKIKVHTVGKRKKPGRRIVERRGRAEMESGSDDERQEDRQSNHNDTDNDSSEDYRRPTNNRTKEFSKHDRTPEGGSNQDRDNDTASVVTPTEPQVNLKHGSPVEMTKAKPCTSDTGLESLEPLTPVKDSRAFTDEIKSDSNVLADNYWEANLGYVDSTDMMEVGQRGRKRKLSEETIPSSKIPRLETGYKVGPRNARPGKIKCLAVSAVHHPVKPAQASTLKAGSRQPSLTLDFTKSSNDLKPKPQDRVEAEPINRMAEVTTKLTTGASKAGSSYGQQEAGVPVKPKPKPRPIKGKASTGELGIVTRDRSKRIAQESVRSTRSKKI